MSDSTIDAAIAAWQAKLGAGLTGDLALNECPENPAEVMMNYPFAVSYPQSGELIFESAGFGNFQHIIITEIHLSRTLLPWAIDRAKQYIEKVGRLIMNDPYITSSVSATKALRYTFGQLQWGEFENLPVYNIGVRFEIDVKIQITGTG